MSVKLAEVLVTAGAVVQPRQGWALLPAKPAEELVELLAALNAPGEEAFYVDRRGSLEAPAQ